MNKSYSGLSEYKVTIPIKKNELKYKENKDLIMTKLQKIEQLLVDLNSKEFDDLQILVNKQIEKNRVLLNLALQEGDIHKIEHFLDKVRFDDKYIKFLKGQVVPHVKSLQYLSNKSFDQSFHISDMDILNSFYLLFSDVLELGQFNEFYKKNTKEELKFPLNNILFASLFHRLKVSFEYSGEDSCSKFLFLKPFLIKDEKTWIKTLNSFCDYSLSKINYKDNSLLISELLKLGFKDQLFQQAKNSENYSYLKSLVSFDNLYNDKFMLCGLSKYHFPMVKEAFEHGIPFFKSDNSMTAEEKAQYKNVFSSVFSSKDSFELQEFIIDNIDNIAIGNHIIAKTILHKLENTYETDFERNDKRLELVHKICTRYRELTSEEILEFKALLTKRKDSYAKKIFENSISYYLLDSKLTPNGVVVKKNKI